jgi:hypothetical protein
MRRLSPSVLFSCLAILGLFVALSDPAESQGPQTDGVTGTAINLSTLNASVTIATGNTFQTILASNVGTAARRQSLTIQNNNTTDSCWLSFGKIGSTTITAGNAAKASSILLLAGGSYTRYWPYVPNDEIEATCTTTSDTLYLDTQ